jgi:hypothetical protein
MEKIALYRHGVRWSGLKGVGGRKPGPRGVITLYSDQSRRRLAWKYGQGPWVSMVVLTYHFMPTTDWHGVKLQLNYFLDCLLYLFPDIQYLWATEFQKRGVVHFHVWLDRRFPERSWVPIARKWLSCSCQDKDNDAVKVHLHDRFYKEWEVRPDNNYAAKYANKQKSKDLPEGISQFGRFWGTRHNLVLEQHVYNIHDAKVFNGAKRLTKRYIEHVRGEREIRKAKQETDGNIIIKHSVETYDRKSFRREKFNTYLKGNQGVLLIGEYGAGPIDAKTCIYERRFSKDPVGSRLAGRQYLNVEHVADVKRLIESVKKGGAVAWSGSRSSIVEVPTRSVSHLSSTKKYKFEQMELF